MVHKRSKLEIYIDVLKIINKGIYKPTRIMYGSNLSWKPLLKVLDSLLEQGLIIKDEAKKRSIYHVTEKGKNILNYLQEATTLLEIG
jgi:predicted transcriptional regulator